ncbi:sialate O-acetylesterase [Coraliomargarita sp. W4R53]
MTIKIRVLSTLLALLPCFSPLSASVSVPAIISDHMVLQREQVNPIWGRAEVGEKVIVSIAGQRKETVTDAQGSWRVTLDPLPVGGPYTLDIQGSNELRFEDVLVGEVWVCSGQSNMMWPLVNTNFAQLEIASANYPNIRLLSIPRNGTQEPQFSFKGQWEVCSPESVPEFSAIGYLFGARLYTALGIPVGLIDNSWGGSSIEAWLPREQFDVDADHKRLLQHWDYITKNYTDETYQQELSEFENKLSAWQANGEKGHRPGRPTDKRYNQFRPANIFNGEVVPILGYGIRGVIWYQGETNSSNAYRYRTTFPLMIQAWREKWGQGDFPFYWVQLADYTAELKEPADSHWAELREAQSMALALPKTGQAVAMGAGEGRDIHPRDKQTVANRLAMLALTKDYGYDFAAESPVFDKMVIRGEKAVLSFKHVELGLYSFDVDEPLGFAIAGADEKFTWAKARIIGTNQIEVWSEDVPAPIAVRYAWATNPVTNVQDRNGLPLTPFRTDDFKLLTQKP